MSHKNTISITEARKNIFQIADEVQSPSVFYTLTERGKPKMVMMSVDEFDSWRETLEVKEDFPDLKNDIKKAEDDYIKGDYVTLEQMLNKNCFMVADKSNKKYGVSSRNTKKNRKKIK